MLEYCIENLLDSKEFVFKIFKKKIYYFDFILFQVRLDFGIRIFC